jgi:hypothetical protein
LSTADIERLWAALPDHRSPIEEILLELGYVGGKYHRYLHQDEFGPSRAERMAGLRELATQFHLLLSQLTGLSKSIRLWLCKQLAQSTTPARADLARARHRDVCIARLRPMAVSRFDEC